MGSDSGKQTGAGKRGGRKDGAFSHWVSQLGILFISIAILGAIGLMVAGWVLPSPGVYSGLLFGIPLVFVLIGGVLIPVGYFMRRHRLAMGLGEARLPPITIDLTLPRHRTVLLLIGIGAAACVIVFAVGSFATFQAMDSNEFCGQTCHKVMMPEYTAYQSAPHARVKCVECHIGSGVEFYLHSKLTGLRRLAAIVTGKYERPIPTPIVDMRPSKEVCEECHWPGRFVGYKEKVHNYFTKGEDSPQHQLRLLLKIGGTDTPFMKGFGIHYHMLSENKVEYVARDRQRQEISWVRVTHKDGSVVEYNHQEFPLTPEERKQLPVRRIECLDCHNRPAHEFKSPMDTVDQVLAAGTLTRSLPYIKVRAVKALDGKYETTDEAMKGIADSMTDYYKENYPDVIKQKGEALNGAIAELQTLYKANFFPEMKAKWSAYPNNIGHRDWPGCYRCHTDKMVSAQGKTIFTDCTKCHLILAQGKTVDTSASVNFSKGAAFIHPGFSDTIKEYTKCIDCHTGGADLY